MTDFIEKLERVYQNEIVKLFRENLGYAYLGNLQYAKDAFLNASGSSNSPIIESELREYLSTVGYTSMQIEGAIHQLKKTCQLNDKKITSLLMVNNRVYELLVSGTPEKPSPEENEKDVMFFDFDHIENNRFAIAEEVSYIDSITGGKNARPDIVVYVNGIALCVIELKRSIVSIEEGIRQNLSNESDLIPSFFTTVQYTIAARHAEHKELESGEKIEDNLYGFKYATIGTPLRFWCPWKKDTNKTGIVLSDTESFEDFFNKKTFMFLFRYGVLSDGGVKKVMRPHQYHALRAAEPRLRDKENGVIWHSQGSGKSLTMVWLAKYIKSNFEDPRVLVITDRIELDIQLSHDFTDAGNNLHRVRSRDDLIKTLMSGEEWLICTLIHKFGLHTDYDKECNNNVEESQRSSKQKRTISIPLDRYLKELLDNIHSRYGKNFKAKGKNIFIFIDECHRTQGGHLHDSMKAIMGQDVMLIGFTGTPLLKNEKENGYKAFRNLSVTKFGQFIHKYLHKQAVEDKVILDLQYEARDVEQEIIAPDKLNEKLEEIMKGLTDDRKALIKDRWATLERVYSSKERIQRIGFNIIDDVKSNVVLKQDWANAMLVAGNIYSAYKYYDFFQNNNDDTCLRNRVAVITSYNPSDADLRKKITDLAEQPEEKFKHDVALQAFHDAGVNDAEAYEEWAKERFVKYPALMKLVIVVDKLLTGFDAPCATFLYIDKEMRDHNLFQAICRVNRLGADVKDGEGKTIFTQKEYGLIVDFKHLFGSISSAVSRFNDEKGGFGGLDATDIEGLLEDNVAKNKKRLEAAVKAFETLKVVWENKGLVNNDQLADYYSTDNEDGSAKERRESLYKITDTLISSYENIADFMPRAGYSIERTNEIEHLTQEAAHINLYVKQKSGDMFEKRAYDTQMRSLLDRYLRAEDVDTILPATAEFSFLDLIDDNSDADEVIDKTMGQAKGNVKGAADVILGKAREVINNSKENDPAFYATFSERLQMILDEIRESRISYEELIRKALQLIKEAKRGGKNFPNGIDTPLKKALWNNYDKFGLDGDNAVENIITIQEMVEHDAHPDYRDPTSADGVLFKGELEERFPQLTQEQIHELYILISKN